MPMSTSSIYAIAQEAQTLKSTNPVKLQDVILLQGESIIFDEGAAYSSSSSCITIEGNKCTAVAQGDATVSALFPETDEYVETTINFSVSIKPRTDLSLEVVDFTLGNEVKYNESAELSFTLKSNYSCTVPVVITCAEETIYAEQLNVQQGSFAYTISTNVLKQKDRQTLTLKVDNITANLEVNIKPPDFTIKINNIPNYLQSGEFIQIGYTVAATGTNKALNASLQVLLDNQTIAKEQLVLSDTLTSKKSTIGVYLPDGLVDGEHKLRLSIVFDERLDIIWDEVTVSTLTANMGLKINGQKVETTDTYTCASSSDYASLNLATVSSKECIKTVSYDEKSFSVGKSSYLAVVALKKAESKIINVVVQSADGAEERSYAITIIRANDNTAVEGTFVDESGNVYTMDVSSLPFRVSLPVDVTNGVLTISVVDESARIVSMNELESNKISESCEVTLDSSGIFECEFKVCADDKSIIIPYEVTVTNLNYSPEVQIVNSQEISNRVFGSKGVLVGKEFLEYGTKTTSVKAALNAGKTKGIVIDLAVSDYNYNQYLAGSIVVQGEEYPIHWNSFNGPEREKAANIEHGYIYIDHTLLTDAEMSFYNIAVRDYADEYTESCLSETIMSVIFGINTLADSISVYFDDTTNELVVDTSASNYSLSYRTSKDNGITWSQPIGCSSRISVKETGRVKYEITLADSMQNTSVKTLVINVKSNEAVEGVNIYMTTTRHADYVYINTLKSNMDTLDIMIADIFK